MSSPFSLETNRGTEETIEALHRASVWASRIDSKNDATELDTSFIEELNKEEDRLKSKYKIKNTEVATDNFVFNNTQEVLKILSDDLDKKYEGLERFNEYISDQFGYVSEPSLSKEELIWLVSKEVQHRREYVDEYDVFDDEFLLELGSKPELWQGNEFPIYNRS